jgi:hypothetical protein
MKKKNYYIFKMDLNCLNILSIILLIGFLIFNHFVVGYDVFNKLFAMDNLFRIVLYYFLYAIIHEILHAISYVLNGGSFNKIIFGVMLEKGILYCLCKQNISKKNILISLMAPFFVIGICTYIIGVYLDIPILVLLSIANMSGCVGDLVMFKYIFKLKDIEFSEFDDPTSFAIYSSSDVSKINHFGLKYVGKKDNINKKNLNKFVISRASILFILFIFIICFF